MSPSKISPDKSVKTFPAKPNVSNLVKFEKYPGSMLLILLQPRYKESKLVNLLKALVNLVKLFFCKNNNIDLYLFSYIYDLGDLIKITDLQTFYNFDEKEILKKIYQYHEDNPKDKFYLKARDEKHPGTAQNYAWYDSLYNIYLERNHVSRG